MTHTNYRQKRYTIRLAVTWTVENFNRISRFTYRCCVYSAFLPRTSIVAIAGRRAPHLATTRKDTPAATVLSCTATRIHWDDLEPSTKPFKRRPAAQIAGIPYGLFGRAAARIVWGDAAVAVRAGVAELATLYAGAVVTWHAVTMPVSLRCVVR